MFTSIESIKAPSGRNYVLVLEPLSQKICCGLLTEVDSDGIQRTILGGRAEQPLRTYIPWVGTRDDLRTQAERIAA
jgi:hypothetical protein